MLVELRVKDLGVIEDLVLRFGPGMTALTGETGAGKTLVVEALELLMGGRADPGLVRAGRELAVVEGRFEDGEEEVVVCREVPSSGRSRAYIDGRMATAGGLAELGGRLVDLHGQHSHQSLLHQGAQRAALDRYGAVSTAEVELCRAELRSTESRLSELGGDEASRARELDLLGFQLSELEAAALSDPDEEEALKREESVLSSAEELRATAEESRAMIGGDEGARDLLGRSASVLGRHEPLADLARRIEALAGELDDIASELRGRSESFESDPSRLAEVQERRRLFSELRRKYGTSLREVISYREAARARLADLEAGEGRRVELEAERERALAALRAAEEAVGDKRREVAPRLAAEIESRLRLLALQKARLEIAVPPDGAGEAVEFLFGANQGEPALPLAKVASGGELARAMLATRLVLSEAPPTLVFDEVDAGIGGEAALHVGRALGELGASHQVLVVTHLAQVAAFATDQVAIEKSDSSGRTLTFARPVSGEDRLTELSRMLSGQPSSEVARRHAEELLEVASAR